MSLATTVPSVTAAICGIRDVTHEFTLPNGKSLTVLENVTLDVRPNEIVALLGPSGCGKSTILRILAGLIKPARGDALYHGERLQGLNPGAAIVFQSFALYPWFTVSENICVVLEAIEVPATEAHERVKKWSAWLAWPALRMPIRENFPEA